MRVTDTTTTYNEPQNIISNFSWIRQLEVSLTSIKSGKKMTFGKGEDYLAIEVQLYKYMSPLADNCVIKIMNLTYGEVVRIIQDEFYQVEIKCGYREGLGKGMRTVFKGGIIFISNDLNDNKTNIVNILCASDLVARFAQRRINLSLNSGINLYSALKFICERAGIPNTNIDTSLKERFLNEVISVNDTPANWVQKVIDQMPSMVSNADSTSNALLTVYDGSKQRKVINLNSKLVNLSGGFPRLTSDGLSLTLMPTMNFICGDVIKIDNSIINIYAGSSSEANSNYGAYLDADGCYTIYSATYALSNRGNKFDVELLCKSYNIFKNITTNTATNTTTQPNQYQSGISNWYFNKLKTNVGAWNAMTR